MISRLSHANLWVLNKDDAIAFYRDVLGCEVRQDMTLDGFRWVEVGPKGQPDLAFTLNEPSPPMMDEESAAAIRTLLEKGAMAGGVFETDDCRGTFEQLSANGVTFLQEPVERPYGVEAVPRQLRELVQPHAAERLEWLSVTIARTARRRRSPGVPVGRSA